MANEGSAAVAKPRVLLVDDSKLIRFSAQKILGSDYDLVLAEDGEAGWERIIEDDAIRLAFTDLSMPNLDGFGLLERVRTATDPRIRDLPVIVVTSGEEAETRQRAFDLGATDFINKPFDSVALVARAKAHTKGAEAGRSQQQAKATDPITGLRTREFFAEQLRRDRALAARHGHEWSILLLELAQFREYFLRYGKDPAYELLGQVGDIVLNHVRTEDTAARIGLAQIALSVPMTGEHGAGVLAQRLYRELMRAQLGAKTAGKAMTPALAVCAPEPNAEDVEQHLQRLGKATASVIAKQGGGLVRLRSGVSKPAAERVAGE